jgi:hypothetical protein
MNSGRVRRAAAKLSCSRRRANVDESSSGHRLDLGADRFGVDLLDPAGEGSQRVDVGWDGELVDVLALI